MQLASPARIALILFFLPQVLWGSPEVITIFGNHTKPPKVYLENNQPKGILCDTLRALGKRLGVTFDIRLYPWNRSYSLAKEGKGGIVGFSKSPERLAKFDYSEPMYYDDVLVGVKKGSEFSFRQMSDLKGKNIAVMRGGSYGMEFEKALKNGTFEVTPVNSHRQIYELILKSRVDGGLVGPGKTGIVSQLRLINLGSLTMDKFSFLEKPFSRDPNFLGFLKSMNMGPFLEKFNAALKDFIDKGDLQKIVKSYEERILAKK